MGDGVLAHPYYCTARISPSGPEIGLCISDPDLPAWRGDFVGEQPFAWCDDDPIGDPDATPECVLVVILTGARHDECAHATIRGEPSGAAWLSGVEHFATDRGRGG
ncbi:MAG TPA: hypothetical protein VFC99_04720 [Acidimicrobiia bacterium]|nr:hypothetical protein [Acidimicrobiia bacterium]